MQKCRAYGKGQVSLGGSIFSHRFGLNRAYVMSLKDHGLLQNYYQEAGLTSAVFRGTHPASSPNPTGDDWHWGWESPTCQLRGHFLGHWLSAAARIVGATGDVELKLKADRVVSELGRCQQKNGGEWVGPIPEKYLHWTAAGQPTWAPHYVLHKTLMGLHDMHAVAGNEQALQIADKWADWFHRWTKTLSREQMDNLLDVETGGMLEQWANLFAVTRKGKYLDLIERYQRSRLFKPLVDGKDMLTNVHANTTIPEAHGVARCYEVTGDKRWRAMAEAYWKSAVTDRGCFCTGGQTHGEIWTPPFEFSARLGSMNQEHCVVYNMIRLADYLFRWTGDVKYADYIERNIYNGLLSQQHPGTGMIAYFLPLEAGSRKVWGSHTHDFWCCHGSLVQAATLYDELTWYEDDAGVVVCQYIPSTLKCKQKGSNVTISQNADHRAGAIRRPDGWAVDFTVKCDKPADFAVKLRMPSWLQGKARILVNSRPVKLSAKPSSFVSISRQWRDDRIRVELPAGLWTSPIPDAPDMVAFMNGPVVLAGICDQERVLHGDKRKPETMLVAHHERQWGTWMPGYRTRNQNPGIKFKPLYEVADERYSVYFQVK